MNRFNQISPLAVVDNNSGLMWTAIESKEVTWTQAAELMKRLGGEDVTDRLAACRDLFGEQASGLAALDGWRLPTIEELFMLADRSKHSPAIDTEFFPDCKRDWYWSATPAAVSPSDCAWSVGFGYGGAFWNDQDYRGFVRAVRAGQ